MDIYIKVLGHTTAIVYYSVVFAIVYKQVREVFNV